MTKKYFLSLTFLMISFFGFSQTEYLDGILILNEGNMGTDSSNIGFLSEDGTITNNIFSAANPSVPMGDVGQSLTMYEDIAIIVMNASNQVHIVNNKTFELITTIDEDVIFPRYTAVYDGKAYITCWGEGANPDDDYLAVIDLETYQVETTIPLSNGIEKIIEIDGKLYIAHQGGYSTNNIVSVYDVATEQVTEVVVGDVPRAMYQVENNLYVLCAGLPFWNPNGPTNAGMYKIDLTTNSVMYNQEFEEGFSAYHMDTDGTYFYITAGADIYKYEIATDTIEEEAFIQTPVENYMGIYGFNIIDNVIYVADAIDYVSDGLAFIYSMEGSLLATHTVGNIPNHFYKSAQSEDTSSVEQQILASISVYPNPTTDVFYVKSDKDLDVTIFDIQGKIVKRATSIQNGINVSDLSKGMYLVELSNTAQKQVVKLIVR